MYILRFENLNTTQNEPLSVTNILHVNYSLEIYTVSQNIILQSVWILWILCGSVLNPAQFYCLCVCVCVCVCVCLCVCVCDMHPYILRIPLSLSVCACLCVCVCVCAGVCACAKH